MENLIQDKMEDVSNEEEKEFLVCKLARNSASV